MHVSYMYNIPFPCPTHMYRPTANRQPCASKIYILRNYSQSTQSLSSPLSRPLLSKSISQSSTHGGVTMSRLYLLTKDLHVSILAACHSSCAGLGVETSLLKLPGMESGSTPRCRGSNPPLRATRSRISVGVSGGRLDISWAK